MSGRTIRRELLLPTLLPLLTLLLVILAYFITQDQKLMHEALHKRGVDVSRYLASAAEYGVITGNFEQLQHISTTVLQGDVVALRVYDFDGREVFKRGDVVPVSKQGEGRGRCGGAEGLLLYCAPIVLGPVEVSDFEGTADSDEGVEIGRLELLVSTHLIAERRWKMLQGSLLMVMAVMLIAVLLIRRMERQLVEPLTTLGRAVERVRIGDLEVQVPESASGELLQLQQGINTMVKGLSTVRDHLQHEVAAATVSLRDALQKLEQRNEELQREQQRAEHASLAKSQFLATMSHEIRTPLSGMIGMLQMLRDGNSNRRQLDCIDGLEGAAQSLRQLIDDILDFSRLEAGKLAIRNQPFRPQGVVEEVMVMLAPSAHHKGLEFVLDLEQTLPQEVVGDPLRFRQVMINLTANAIKFTRRGEVVVRARPVVGDQGGVWRFEIIDSGIGIPPEKQGMVFESFTQLDDGDARSFGGSGLGATVSRDLVVMMGGRIGLESEPGKGSCFWFELPWAHTDGYAMLHPVGRGGRCLLLERSTASAQAIAGLMSRFDIACTTVVDEAGLLQRLSVEAYDWVVICENGPEASHAALLQRLATELPPASRLLQLGFVNGTRVELPRVSYLAKPLLPSALLRLMRHSEELPAVGAGVEEVTPPLTVLLAEDEAINARVIAHFLAQGGHRVVRVEDGAAALERLRSEAIDCVLMDLRMPGMDGLEATRRWRAEESGGRMPIIALTANASEEDRRRCHEAGMDDYLTKPVDSRALLSTLGRLCHTVQGAG